MTRSYHLIENRRSDETGDAYLNLFLAVVRLAQRDVDNPATLDYDDKETVRQDAVEFLEWVAELAQAWQEETSIDELMQPALSLGSTKQRIEKSWNAVALKKSRGEAAMRDFFMASKRHVYQQWEARREDVRATPSRQIDLISTSLRKR